MATTPSAKKSGNATKKVVASNHPSNSHYPKTISLTVWGASSKAKLSADADNPRRRFARPPLAIDLRIERLSHAVDFTAFEIRLAQLHLAIKRLNSAALAPVATTLFQLVKQEQSRKRRNRLVELLSYVEQVQEKAKFEADPDLRDRVRLGAGHLARKAQSSFPAIPVPVLSGNAGQKL